MTKKRECAFTADDAHNMLRVALFTLWPITAVAAGQHLGNAFSSVSLADWLSLITLSFVSGLVALLHRIRKSLEANALLAAGETANKEDQQLIPWWLFALCHMAGAMFVGGLAFLGCEAIPSINIYLEALFIALTSWSGAKVADKMADGLSDTMIARVSALFGKRS